VPIPTPIWAENARAKSEADLENAAKFDSVIEAVWNDPAPSREPPTIPRMVSSDEFEERATIRSVTNPLAKKRRSFGIRPKEKEEEASLGQDNNPGVIQYVSDGYFQDPRSLKRQNESTSTIFQNSPLAPVKIIVTTPEEEVRSLPPSPTPEPRNSFNSIRASRTANVSTTSLPATRFSRNFSTDSLPLLPPKRLDPNRLMPPTEHQIDTRRLRKAQEFREIRKFLIHFMNAKGDQFPKKLRCRMMEAYAVTDSDLSPEVVARFNDLGNDMKDEGVALEQLGMNELDKETTDAEDLRILSMAFQSRIPDVTPSREVTRVDSIPIRPRGPSVSKPAPAGKPPPPTPPKSNLPPPLPPKSILRSGTEPAKKEKKEEDEPLNWLGPLISTSTAANSDWSLPLADDSSDHSRLQKAHSQPNMSRHPTSPAPPVPASPNSSSYLAGKGRGRGESLSVYGSGTGIDGVGMEKAIHVARVKRQGIIAGAFGAVREAMGGKKVGLGGEKRRLIREGR
jgi:hypothetical protein